MKQIRSILVLVLALISILIITLATNDYSNNSKIEKANINSSTKYPNIIVYDNPDKSIKTFTLYGTVFQMPFNTVAKNTTVEIVGEALNIRTTTDDDGSFLIKRLPMVKMSIIASYDNGNISEGVWLDPKNDEEKVVIYLPSSGYLQVLVVNQSRQPIDSATVNLTNVFSFSNIYKGSRIIKRNLILKTNNIGAAYFMNIRISKTAKDTENYWLKVSHPDYHDELVYPIDIKPGSNTTTVTVKKDAQQSQVLGRLCGKGGAILNNSKFWGIIQTIKGGKYVKEIKSDEYGVFSFNIKGKSDTVKEGLYQAKIILKVWIEGYEPLEKIVTSSLKEGEKLDIGIIELEPGKLINGFVYDANRNPVKEAKVLIEKSGKVRTEQSLILKTDEKGYFETRSLANESYDIFVESKDYPAGTVDIKDCIKKNITPNTFNIYFVLKKAK